MSQVAVLDIGESQVTYAVASLRPRFRIDAMASAPNHGYRKGQISDVRKVAEAVHAAVTEANTTVGDSVVVTLGGWPLKSQIGKGIKVLVPKSRTVTHQDVLDVVNSSKSGVGGPGREVIQVIPRSFGIDQRLGITKPVGEVGTRLEVESVLVSADSASLEQLESAVASAAKLSVQQFLAAPLAAGIGVLTSDEIRAGVAVVDIGAGTTDVAIFEGGSVLAMRSIPISSRHITADVATLLKTADHEAERLKTEYGSALARLVPENYSVEVQQLGNPVRRPMQQRVLAEIIQARCREIAKQVKRTLATEGGTTRVRSLVLTGNGARLKGFADCFTEELDGLPTRVATPEEGTAVALGAARYVLQCADELSTASGGQSWKDRVRTLFMPRK